jgi:hypothetical protein
MYKKYSKKSSLKNSVIKNNSNKKKICYDDDIVSIQNYINNSQIINSNSIEIFCSRRADQIKCKIYIHNLLFFTNNNINKFILLLKYAGWNDCVRVDNVEINNIDMISLLIFNIFNNPNCKIISKVLCNYLFIMGTNCASNIYDMLYKSIYSLADTNKKKIFTNNFLVHTNYPQLLIAAIPYINHSDLDTKIIKSYINKIKFNVDPKKNYDKYVVIQKLVNVNKNCLSSDTIILLFSNASDINSIDLFMQILDLVDDAIISEFNLMNYIVPNNAIIQYFIKKLAEKTYYKSVIMQSVKDRNEEILSNIDFVYRNTTNTKMEITIDKVDELFISLARIYSFIKVPDIICYKISNIDFSLGINDCMRSLYSEHICFSKDTICNYLGWGKFLYVIKLPTHIKNFVLTMPDDYSYKTNIIDIVDKKDLTQMSTINYIIDNNFTINIKEFALFSVLRGKQKIIPYLFSKIVTDVNTFNCFVNYLDVTPIFDNKYILRVLDTILVNYKQSEILYKHIHEKILLIAKNSNYLYHALNVREKYCSNKYLDYYNNNISIKNRNTNIQIKVDNYTKTCNDIDTFFVTFFPDKSNIDDDIYIIKYILCKYYDSVNKYSFCKILKYYNDKQQLFDLVDCINPTDREYLVEYIVSLSPNYMIDYYISKCKNSDIIKKILYLMLSVKNDSDDNNDNQTEINIIKILKSNPNIIVGDKKCIVISLQSGQHVNIIELLIKNGAIIDRVENNHLYYYYCYKKYPNFKLFELLFKYNIDVDLGYPFLNYFTKDKIFEEKMLNLIVNHKSKNYLNYLKLCYSKEKYEQIKQSIIRTSC